jgi:hypothetical protein
VYVAGESAGAFIALSAAFTDQASEKHAACYAIANAPAPDVSLSAYGCIPAHLDLSRPDLGGIDGSLHTGSFDAKVKGVASFYGAVMDYQLFQQTTDTPWVYLYHQGSDVVVHYMDGLLLGRVSWECFAPTNLCQNYYFYPWAHGGESIRNYFSSLAIAPHYTADIINNYNYTGDCFANGHSIDNLNLRLQHMLNLFSQKIQSNGNVPNANCTSLGIANMTEALELNIFPNPASQQINLSLADNWKESSYVIMDIYGRKLAQGVINRQEESIDISALPNGRYMLELSGVKPLHGIFVKQ